jgi:hypothetical protein
MAGGNTPQANHHGGSREEGLYIPFPDPPRMPKGLIQFFFLRVQGIGVQRGSLPPPSLPISLVRFPLDLNLTWNWESSLSRISACPRGVDGGPKGGRILGIGGGKG